MRQPNNSRKTERPTGDCGCDTRPTQTVAGRVLCGGVLLSAARNGPTTVGGCRFVVVVRVHLFGPTKMLPARYAARQHDAVPMLLLAVPLQRLRSSAKRLRMVYERTSAPIDFMITAAHASAAMRCGGTHNAENSSSMRGIHLTKCFVYQCKRFRISSEKRMQS